jgi:drug/metabolite transporter (DMT)-like permease
MRITDKQMGWIILLILILIWGSSFILIKRGLQVYSSVEVGAIRIFVSFVVLLPAAIRNLKKADFRTKGYIFLVGLVGTGFPAFLFAKAQTVIDSSLAGILNSLTPLFTLIAGVVFFRRKARWMSTIGVIIGLAGAVGLVYSKSGGSFKFHFGYSLFAIIATVLYAFQSNLVKKYLNEVPTVTIASLGFFFIGIPATVLLFGFTGFTTKFVNHPDGVSSFLYIVILAIFASAITIILFNKLIQITDAVFASSVTYFIPVVALLWGIGDGEKYSLPAFLFISLIIAGVLLVNKNRDKKVKKRM